ncbi:MAG TPA: DUF2231 domain-containing protein [Candidatus Udaeobacter sp.]|nr:DUF2231 domain-containing protein [Candidatus Udaeobacter sp.]
MNRFFAASPNPFDLKAALLAAHVQHPVIVHFPIALFIASVVFDILAVWRKQPILATVGYFNLVGAAITVPFAIATGLGAWRWQLEGAMLKGNLRLHLICALTSAALILGLCLKRSRLRGRSQSPRVTYFIFLALAVVVITVTGHLGGILSGVETP